MTCPGASRQFRRRATTLGFTILEVLIVLVVVGLVVALALPRFSNAAETGRAAALREQLRSLRTEILLYRAAHDGIAPGYPRNDLRREPTSDTMLAQLTQATARADLPPNHIPVNPFTGSSTILIVPANAAFPAAAQGDQGWVYQPSTGTFASNVPGADPDGVAYFDY
jgi:general secretion pathway protein G